MSTRAKVFWAFAAVYLIWGSTYLAIQIGVGSLPPFFLGSARFVTAGLLIYLWARLQGEPNPPASVWRVAALLGTLFFVFGNGLVVWAEQHVPSGRTALLASTSPIWTVILESAVAGWRMPQRRVVLGVGLGLVGLILLASPDQGTGQAVSVGGVLALVGASLAWSIGSVYSYHHALPASPAMATGLKMIGGGAQLALVGLLAGDWQRLHVATVSWQAWAALAYLITFGSIIGFTAFTYLLRVTTPQKVNTSAYINPVVAVVLGWSLAGETVTARMIVGAVISLSGVILIRGAAAVPIDEPPEVGTLETGEFPIQPRAR